MVIPEPTPELVREICNNLSAGMLRGDAAELAGVDRETLTEWMRRAAKGTEPFTGIRKELSKAELTSQRRLLTSLALAASSDPRYAAWLLTHRWRKGWSDSASEEALPTSRQSAGQLDAEMKTLATKIRPRFALLPWENVDQFEELLTGLLLEHLPQGPTEQHLVEELAGVLLHKGRLRLAETASHRHRLKELMGPLKSTAESAVAHLGETKSAETVAGALAVSDDEAAAERADATKGNNQIKRVISILESTKENRYQAALSALGDKKEWWTDALSRKPDEDEEDQELFEDTAEGLLGFLQKEVVPWYAKQLQGLEHRPLIREQAFGESFDSEDIEKIRRIEAYLDRKMAKTLDTLLRLQELRRAKTG